MLLLSLALSILQDPSPATAKSADPLLRLPAGITISNEEYRDRLVSLFGTSHLEELALDKILAFEVAALELTRIPAATRSALAEPDARARARIEARIREEHAGDRSAYERALRDTGFTPAQALASTRLAAEREDRITALVQSQRVADETSLRRIFDDLYGVDGKRAVVRHVYQSFGKVANELRERRVEPPPARVEAIVLQRIQALWEEHEKGVDFADLVRKGSDDPEARRMAADPKERAQAGTIPGYNYQHFGVELAEAVRAMRPGEVRGPIKTSHGYHIVKLESLRTTELESVRAELLTLQREAPPSLLEQRLLRERLLEKHKVRAALPK